MSKNKPKPIPRKTPGGGQPSGKLTMREQIAARRKAEEAGAGAAPAPKAAPKAAAKPAAKPAAKAAPRAAAKPAAAAAKPAAARGSARPSSRSGAKRAGAGRSRRGEEEEEDDDNGGTTRGRRARSAPKKKSPVPAIAAAVVVLGGGAAFFLMPKGEVEASGSETTEEVAGADTAAAAADGATADTAPGDAEAAADAPVADVTGAPADGENDAAAAADAPAKPAAAKKPEGPGEDVDLSVLEPFGKPDGATDEQWTELQEKAAVFFDPDAGAAGGRAKKKLIEAGKLAWPAILNEFVKIDPGTAEGHIMGMNAQRALNDARGGTSQYGFDWRSPENSADGVPNEKEVRFNKKIIRGLHASWAKVVDDPAHWAKLDQSESAEEAAEALKKKMEAEAELGVDVDDLDIGDIEID